MLSMCRSLDALMHILKSYWQALLKRGYVLINLTTLVLFQVSAESYIKIDGRVPLVIRIQSELSNGPHLQRPTHSTSALLKLIGFYSIYAV